MNFNFLYSSNIKFIPKGLLLLLACLSLSIASAQHITSDKGYYGLSVRDSVLLENKYDTIYNALSEERGPITDFYKLDSVVYVFKEKEKYGYLIVYSKIEFGDLNQDMKKHIATTISSIEKSDVEYDSIYWVESINRNIKWWSNDEREKCRSLLILEKENKFGFLFLNWSTRKTPRNYSLYFAGFESSTVFEPKYDTFTMDNHLIVEDEDQFGIIFSNQQIIEPQYDSIKEVAQYYTPLKGYFVWKQGNCGMIINNQLSLPIKYQVQDLEIAYDKTMATVIIKTSGEPYTLFFPKDSTYLRIKTESGFVLNSDSIVSFLEIHQRTISPACVLYVTRYDTVGPKYKKFFPEWPGQAAGVDQVYFLDKKNGNVIASYTNKESKYIIFTGMVAEITPKNNRKKKYKITIYKKLDKTILTEYTWPYYSGNTIIEIPEYADGADGEMYYVFGYFNSKDVFKRIGYIHTTNMTFHKKID